MLARVESEVAWVAEAWMSRDGNLLVVVPRPGATPDEAVDRLLREANPDAVRLDGLNRETVLAMFADREGWIRAGTEDNLTAEEADRVSERIVRRVEARVALDPEDRAALVRAVRARFLEGIGGDGDPVAAVVADAAAFLDPPAVEGLRAALDAGWRPVEGE